MPHSLHKLNNAEMSKILFQSFCSLAENQHINAQVCFHGKLSMLIEMTRSVGRKLVTRVQKLNERRQGT